MYKRQAFEDYKKVDNDLILTALKTYQDIVIMMKKTANEIDDESDEFWNPEYILYN